MALFTRAPKAEPILGQNKTAAMLLGLLTWVISLFFFFPLFWLVLSSFKEELDANSSPKLFFDPTLDQIQRGNRGNPGSAQLYRSVRQLVLDRRHLDA